MQDTVIFKKDDILLIKNNLLYRCAEPVCLQVYPENEDKYAHATQSPEIIPS